VRNAIYTVNKRPLLLPISQTAAMIQRCGGEFEASISLVISMGRCSEPCFGVGGERHQALLPLVTIHDGDWRADAALLGARGSRPFAIGCSGSVLRGQMAD
jgi:hypothetical protein